MTLSTKPNFFKGNKERKPLFNQDAKEFAIVGIVMTVLMLPVRLAFVEYVDTSTLGSFGLITAISIVMIVLARKGKLGKFGKMFERQLFKLTTGRSKKRLFVTSWLVMSLCIFGFMLYAIELGNTVYFDEKERIKAEVMAYYNVEFDNLAEVGKTAEVISAERLAEGMPEFGNALFTNFKAIAITEAIVNDMSHGMIQHLSIVFFVEQMEILGIMIFYGIMFKTGKLKPETYIEKTLQEPRKPRKRIVSRRRLGLMFIFVAIFSGAYQLGTFVQTDQVEAEQFMESFKEKVKDIDAVGIFQHNTLMTIPMMTPFFGTVWGSLTGFQTGVAYSAFVTAMGVDTNMPALALLFMTPFGLMEVFAYGIAMSRGFILTTSIIKGRSGGMIKANLRSQIKPLIIESAIIVALLLVGGFVEYEMIQWVKSMGVATII